MTGVADGVCNTSFKRVLSIIATDGLAANFAAEKLVAEHEEAKYPNVAFGRLHLSCDVRKCHGIGKSMFNLYPFLLRIGEGRAFSEDGSHAAVQVRIQEGLGAANSGQLWASSFFWNLS